jgi:hypothetical protein
MGREIRNVPPNWQHPETQCKYTYKMRPQPMFNWTFEAAFADWLANFDRIRSGKLDAYEIEAYPRGLCDWVVDHHAPDPAFYVPWTPEEATWFQLWQTVSEGTPVSPAFATKEELAAHLAEHGDAWDQTRCWNKESCKLFGLTFGKPGWGADVATAFVMGDGWAPSMVIQDGSVMSGVQFTALPLRPAI